MTRCSRLAILVVPTSPELRGKLCTGVHRDVEVTDAAGEDRPLVSRYSAIGDGF
jgi:hypothetical protein